MHFDKGVPMNDLSRTRRRVSCLAMAFTAVALAAPAAQANHADGNPAKHLSSPASVPLPESSSLQIDRLAPKYVALHRPASPPQTAVLYVAGPAGFDWPDAGIGAGVASLTLALLAGLAMVVRRSRRTIVPERSELAGA
jgi:hypothetical protein